MDRGQRSGVRGDPVLLRFRFLSHFEGRSRLRSNSPPISDASLCLQAARRPRGRCALEAQRERGEGGGPGRVMQMGMAIPTAARMLALAAIVLSQPVAYAQMVRDHVAEGGVRSFHAVGPLGGISRSFQSD